LPATSAAERAVVGCLLIDCGLRAHARGLKMSDFADQYLGAVFDCLMSIDGPADLIIVVDELEMSNAKPPRGTGWAEFVAATMDNIPSVEHVREYVAIVRRSSISRRLSERSAGGFTR